MYNYSPTPYVPWFCLRFLPDLQGVFFLPLWALCSEGCQDPCSGSRCCVCVCVCVCVCLCVCVCVWAQKREWKRAVLSLFSLISAPTRSVLHQCVCVCLCMCVCVCVCVCTTDRKTS